MDHNVAKGCKRESMKNSLTQVFEEDSVVKVLALCIFTIGAYYHLAAGEISTNLVAVFILEPSPLR